MASSDRSAAADTTTLVVSGVVFLVLVSGYVTLAALHIDTIGYAVFVTGPIVSTIVGAVLARRVGAVQAVAEDVRKATNGMLTTRLDLVDDQLVAASAERQVLAAGADREGPAPAAGA